MTHEGKLQRLLICVLVNPRRIRCFVAHFTVDSRSTSSRRRRTIMLFVTHIIIAYIESKVITSLPTSPSPTQLSLHPSQTQPQSSINQPIEHPPLSTNPHHHALDNNHINHINHINHSHPNANPDPAPLPDPRPHPPNPPRRIILWTTLSTTTTIVLVKTNAEPWAYLLCIAGVFLYVIITGFRRKYYKVSPKSSRDNGGNNRRARRRVR
jgi:hypothetical protein